MRKVAIAVALLLASCLKPSAFECGDGRTCPADTVCDERNSMCLTQSQASVCKDDDIAIGKPCDADGTPGICNMDGYCEPGCGDGVTDTTEQCDDGNFASHDGCSSRCLVEVPTWVPDVPVWKGVSQLSAAYHPNIGSGRIVVIGGVDEIGISNKIWQIDPARADELDGGWIDITNAFAPGERPEPRYAAPFAFHVADNALVLYGGTHSTGYYADTWEYKPSTRLYNGEPVGTWTKRTTTGSPGAYSGPSLAYEPTLGKLVLYGGSAVPSIPATMRPTWFYANGTWTSMLTTTKPITASRQAMAYDENRGVMVLYTASGTPRTYEFSGTDWVEVSGGGAPGTHRGGMMAYDPTRLKVVMFGGSDYTQSQVKGDTWEYDGAWQQVQTPVAPPARRTAALVSDPVNGRLVLFGGSLLDGSDPFGDEWEFTPSGWADRTPRFSPPASVTGSAAYSTADGGLFVVGGALASFELWSHNGEHWHRDNNLPVDRMEHQLAYDSDLKRILMTGGYCGYSDLYDCDPDMDGMDLTAMPLTTYAMDIATRTWSKLPALWPANKTRSVFAYVYDAVGHRSVVFGGYPEGGSVRSAETWVSDGNTWTELVTAEHPAGTVSPAAGWDPVRMSVIVFDLEGDTWELRDSNWTKLIPTGPSVPVGREQGGMVYNPYRKRFVLVGGHDKQNALLEDIWELDTETLTWTRLFVPGTSPLPRTNLVLGMHESRRAPLLYGGISGTLFGRDDVWFLEYESDTRDEDCTDGMDTDEDQQDDTEDPDCTPLPPH